MARHLESGRAAERVARARLESHCLTWVASNYTCRYGELDLVMLEGPILVVVEVRYRRHTGIVDPARSLTPQKLWRIVRATEHFRQHHRRWHERRVRFDVVGLHGPLDDTRLNWIRGAFTIDDLTDD